MKNLNLLVWLTQLGLSVAAPLAGFIMIGVWLKFQFNWGNWIVWVGIILGLVSAIGGLRSSLKTMDMLAGKEDKEAPGSFNDHD